MFIWPQVCVREKLSKTLSNTKPWNFKLFALSIRVRSQLLHQSECRRKRRETNGAAIHVNCVTKWLSVTWSGQVRHCTMWKYHIKSQAIHFSLYSNINNIMLHWDVNKCSIVLCLLFLQLTWSLKNITIMWGRRGSLILTVTNPRLLLHILHLLHLLQRLQRDSRRTGVLLLPRTPVTALRSLPTKPQKHTRKYL